jgi:hypothetical protein
MQTRNNHRRQISTTLVGFESTLSVGEGPQTYLLRWIHTCNVTAYRNAVTLQATDTKLSYDLNFQPVPHGVQYPASVTQWGSQFVTGAKSIMNVQKARRAEGGDVSRCTSWHADAVTVSFLWCDSQIPAAHRTCP